MCGIAGIVESRPGRTSAELQDLGRQMGDRLAHRGPDDCGTWADAQAGVVLAHRRLAIIDVSPTGSQPMCSADGRWVIAYNGEIYNFRELRRQLEGAGHRFVGRSDTEVLLAAVQRWGLVRAVQRCDGMFAFALWNRHRRSLALVRDRMGEKPLYYGWANGDFVFASELKALRAHPRLDRSIDRDALALFLRHKYIPAPHTVYRSIRKLSPGVLLEMMPERGASSISVTPYWSLDQAVRKGQDDLLAGSEREVLEEVHGGLLDAVGSRLVADVPLGAFLSGGIDSSAVVALMQEQSEAPVRTFTVGFGEAEFNEATHARLVAEHLGTDHTELYVTSNDALATVPELPRIYDEPFADPSQIPTYLVSQLARRHVTVSLSGDGGDELFGGYGRYARAAASWNQLGRIPRQARVGLARPLSWAARHWPRKWTHMQSRLVPASWRARPIDDVLARGADAMAAPNGELLYRTMVSDWILPSSVALQSREPATLLCGLRSLPPLDSLHERMMFIDARTYLPDDILVKLDRASMAVSLEARVPLLDHRLVELSWRLPLAYRFRNGVAKWVLRQVLYRYVPRELVERPKQGFGVPLSQWLQGPLREWAAALLTEGRLRREGFLAAEPIRRLWERQLAGEPQGSDRLWNVLMFQAWLEHEREDTAHP